MAETADPIVLMSTGHPQPFLKLTFYPCLITTHHHSDPMGRRKRGQITYSQPSRPGKASRRRRQQDYEDDYGASTDVEPPPRRTGNNAKRARVLREVGYSAEEITRRLAIQPFQAATATHAERGEGPQAAAVAHAAEADGAADLPGGGSPIQDELMGFSDRDDGGASHRWARSEVIQVEGRTRRSKQMGDWNSRMDKLVQAYMFWERTTDSGRAAEELPEVVWCPCGEGASHNWEEMLLVTMKGMPEVNGRLALPLLTDSCSQG